MPTVVNNSVVASALRIPPTHLLSDGLDGIEVALGGNGEPSFAHVDAETAGAQGRSFCERSQGALGLETVYITCDVLFTEGSGGRT